MVGHLHIWAAGSASVGAGHLVRSRVVGEAMQALGWQVSWYCPDPEGVAAWAWADLPRQSAPAPPRVDSQRDVLLIDGYEAATPVSATSVVRIHDYYAGAEPQASMIIEGMPGARASDYPQAIPCVGLAYALLRPEFVACDRPRDSGTVLLVLGGTDAAELLPTICQQLLRVDTARQVLVAGVDSAPVDNARIHPLGRLPAAELAKHLQTVGAAVVSASATALEALACACPMLAIPVAENQRRIADYLRIIDVPVLEPQQLSQLSTALSAPPSRHPPLLDGRGPERVAERIHDWWCCRQANEREWRFRPARFADAEQLYTWLQDPGVRAASLQGGSVPTWHDHCAWLEARLRDPNCRMYIAESVSQAAMGTLRLQRSANTDDEAVVSISTDPDYRGQGLGPRLLQEGAKLLAANGFARRLQALVRLDNPASLRCFSKAGFVRADNTRINGQPTAVFYYEVSAHAP